MRESMKEQVARASSVSRAARRAAMAMFKTHSGPALSSETCPSCSARVNSGGCKGCAADGPWPGGVWVPESLTRVQPPMVGSDLLRSGAVPFGLGPSVGGGGTDQEQDRPPGVPPERPPWAWPPGMDPKPPTRPNWPWFCGSLDVGIFDTSGCETKCRNATDGGLNWCIDKNAMEMKWDPDLEACVQTCACTPCFNQDPPSPQPEDPDPIPDDGDPPIG